MLVRKLIALILIIFLMQSCIDRYDFVIKNQQPTLVVEGFVSNVSYKETLDYPSDGRYFKVKLSQTSDVVNIKGGPLTGASVSLLADDGVQWTYQELDPGTYILLDDNFKACDQVQYKLRIQSGENTFESKWQSLPDGSNDMGDISFEETYKYTYEYVASEKVVTNTRGINAFIDVPENSNGLGRNFKWDFKPTWIYESSLFPPVNKRCWVNSSTYLSNFVLQEDFGGGYKQKLFFKKTTGNERFIYGFSLLVRQFMLNEGYYQFLSDIKKQSDDGLFSAPPYNLETNLLSVEGGDMVVGYFGIVREAAKRWYFNTNDLSYLIKDEIKVICENPLAERERGPACWDCLAYPHGDATKKRPSWWEDH